MKKKSRTIRRKMDDPIELVDQPVIFCTECGATLENFCVSRSANDLEAIRKTLAQCRRQGKFSGDLCSKLFMAHPDVFEEPGVTDKYPDKSVG